MEKQYRGIIVPVITPLKERGKIDFKGMERLLDHVVKGGVHGVFILGTSGEGPAISRENKLKLIERTNFFLKGRTKLLVGITDTSMEETLGMASIAAEHGADAVAIAPPPYFPFTQEELYDYARFVVRQSPLPVMLYNIPKMTKTSYGVETIDRLTEEDNIVGFKDSSKDIAYFKEVLAVTVKRPDWSVLTGFEDLLVESIDFGGDGGVLAGGNIYPQKLVKFYNAIMKGNKEEVITMEQQLSEIRKIYTLGSGVTSTIQAIKYALELKGICRSQMTFPFGQLNQLSKNFVKEITVNI